MIIKNILNKIKISYYTYLMFFLGLITGLFKDLSCIFSLCFIHEIGHLILGLHYSWNIKKIIIYPFGGFTKYEDKIDKPLKEEFIISISGIIFQTIYYVFMKFLNAQFILSDYYFFLLKKYHYSMIIFNLLPIIPLDGSKIYNVLLNKFICFRKSYYVNIIMSIITFVIFIIYLKGDLSTIFIFSFLVFEIYKSFKDRNYYFNKFIYEKYLYKTNYRKYKYIDNIKKMFRNRKNMIKFNNYYISEDKYIKKRSIK